MTVSSASGLPFHQGPALVPRKKHSGGIPAGFRNAGDGTGSKLETLRRQICCQNFHFFELKSHFSQAWTIKIIQKVRWLRGSFQRSFRGAPAPGGLQNLATPFFSKAALRAAENNHFTPQTAFTLCRNSLLSPHSHPPGQRLAQC